MIKLFKSLKFLFMPSYWIMIKPYSAEWDKILNSLLETYDFKVKDQCTAFLGKHEIWIETYPYACFFPYGTMPSCLQVRPSRLTILRAHKKLVKDLCS